MLYSLIIIITATATETPDVRALAGGKSYVSLRYLCIPALFRDFFSTFPKIEEATSLLLVTTHLLRLTPLHVHLPHRHPIRNAFDGFTAPEMPIHALRQCLPPWP